MAYGTGAGTQFFYCANPGVIAEDISGYEALVWVKLTGVETVSEFGDAAQAITFNILDEGRTRKVKGPRDAGDITVTCAHDPLSASQAAMKGFSDTDYSYAFKALLADAADANDTDSVFYFSGKVMSARLAAGETTAERRRVFVIGIDTAVLEDTGEAVS